MHKYLYTPFHNKCTAMFGHVVKCHLIDFHIDKLVNRMRKKNWELPEAPTT